jgi:hypothetical protein
VQELDKKFESLEMRVNNNTESIASLSAQLASTTAMLADLEARVSAGVSGTSTASTTIIWSADFASQLYSILETAGLKLQGGIAYITNAVVETFSANVAYIKTATIESASVGALEVGTSDKRAGITLYDEITGQPYCLKVSGGQTISTFGSCSLLQGAVLDSNAGNGGTGGDTGGTTGDTGTTTPDGGSVTGGDSVTTDSGMGDTGTTTPDVVTGGDTGGTPDPVPAPEPSPEPAPETAPIAVETP